MKGQWGNCNLIVIIVFYYYYYFFFIILQVTVVAAITRTAGATVTATEALTLVLDITEASHQVAATVALLLTTREDTARYLT